MVKPAPGIERWVLINASPEAVFAYLADLPRHGEWDAQTGFRVLGTSEAPVAKGSFCQRERFETFQAPILRGGAVSSQVSWVRSLTVTGCVLNQALDFETKNLYNGLSVGVEAVSFRLYPEVYPEGIGTRLVMTSKRRANMPGPFYLVMIATEWVQGLASRLLLGWFLRTFPGLRSNGQLSRIKTQVEQM